MTEPLPQGWTLRPLTDIAQINPPLGRCVASDDAPVTFVPMRAVGVEGSGFIAPETRPYKAVKKGYTAFRSGDIIMAKITPCMENGKTMLVPNVPGGICFGSTEFHVIRPEKGINGKWIELFLLRQETRREAQLKMGGAVGQMRVPATFLQSLQVPVSPQCEQGRIARFIEEISLDMNTGIAALKSCQEKLGIYRASLLKAAVEGDLTADWRSEHPDAEPAGKLLQRILAERRERWEQEQIRTYAEKGKAPPKNWKAKYKEPIAPEITDLPAVPTNWKWVGFDQIGAIQGGLQKSPLRKPTHNHFPYLRVANVHRGRLLLDKLHRFELTSQELRKLRLEAGDILLVEGNGSRTEIGRCALWNGEVEDCVHQNHIIRVRLAKGVLPQYVSIFLNSPVGQFAIQQAASSTSGLYTLSVNKVKRLSIALPPLAEQEAIADHAEGHISRVDEVGTALLEQLARSTRLRQSVLHQAFSGKLVPQNPNDEPASKLLERIANEREARQRKAKRHRNAPARAEKVVG